MDPHVVLSFIETHGYLIIFLIMIFEGPIINFVASFAASLGYFNIFIIVGLAILGDVIGDIFFYFLGIISKKKIIKTKFSSKIKYLEKLSQKHIFKTMLFIKLNPPISNIGLFTLGLHKIKFKKFLFFSFLFAVIFQVFFSVLGYMSGISIQSFTNYFNSFKYIFLIIFVIVGVTLYLYFKTHKIFNKQKGKNLINKK